MGIHSNHFLKHPLTSEQTRIWLEWKLNPQNRAFNTSMQLHLEGKIDLRKLENAIWGKLRFVEMARTTFDEDENGQPFQRTIPYLEILRQYSRLPMLEFTDLTKNTDENNKQLEKIAGQKVIDRIRHSFNLKRYPSWRYSLIKYSPNKYFFVLVASHILSDGYSGAVSLRLISELYNRPFFTLQILRLLKWTGVFKTMDDYLNFRKKNYTKIHEKRDKEYWQKQFKDVKLPVDFRIPATLEKGEYSKGYRIRFCFDHLTTSKIKSFIKEQKSTLFLFLAAVYNLMLHRYSGQNQIVIAYPSSTRPKNYRLLCGFFVNNLLLRTQIKPNQNFLELLQDIGKRRLEDRKHKLYPYSFLLRDLRREKGKNIPLCNVAMGETAFGSRDLSFRGLKINAITDVDCGEVMYDLNLLYDANLEKELELGFEFREANFKREFAEEMILNFKILTKTLLSRSEAPVLKVSMISADQKEKIISKWNATQKEYSLQKTVMELFEEQVERTPNLLACKYEVEELRYHELNRRANQLCHYLLNHFPIQNDWLVGVYLPRSIEMIVSLLGIIKAGGAYLPLDLDFPEHKLSAILEDARPTCILTLSSFAHKLKPYPFKLFFLDELRKELNRQPIFNPEGTYKNKGLAYVLYTSGSTGKPKGVMIEHFSVVNRILWMQHQYKLTETDRVLQKTPYTFDVSVWEFFWSILTGASLHFARPEGHKDAHYLIELIEGQNITTIHFVPSMLRLFLETLELYPSPLKCLKNIFCSGEALPTILKNKCLDILPNARLYNLYGPTEATVDVSYYNCIKGLHDDCVNTPIGKPVDNTQLYILDDYQNLLPIGCPGELYIGGCQLARGYLNQEYLTSKRFIPNPFQHNPYEKLYKTGDLARYLPDGNIEFLGRMDTQVKWHGFRIELGEIEKAILNFNLVLQAVVVMREDTPTGKQLVAYVVLKKSLVETNTEAPVVVNALKNHLCLILPNYMLPAYYEFINEIPLSPNGKCDHKQLPPVHSTLKIQTVPKKGRPLNKIELKWHKIWQDVLGITHEIHLEDNFFSLGGDSLLAIKMVNVANKDGLPITVSQLFENPTIKELASLEYGKPTAAEHAIGWISPAMIEKVNISSNENFYNRDSVEAAYRLTRMQEFMVKNYMRKNFCYHFQEFFYLEEEGFDQERFIESLQAAVARQPILRSSFLMKNSQLSQIVRKNVNLPLQKIDHQGRFLNKKQCEIYLNSILKQDRETKPFRVEDPEGLLYRIYLVRFSDHQYGLAISWHHAIIDGWSNIEFLRNVFQHYLTPKDGSQNVLENFSVNSFQEFVAYENEIIKFSYLKKFWQRNLKSFPFHRIPSLSLSGEGSSAPDVYFETKTLDQVIGKKILDYGKQHKVHVKTIFLAAYIELIANLIQKNEISVGIVTNRRTPLLTEPLKTIGYFWNLMPFLYSYNKDLGVKIQEVNKKIEELLPFSAYPFSQILKDLEVDDQALFFATFNFIHFHNASEMIQEIGKKGIKFSMKHYNVFHYPLNILCQQIPTSNIFNIFMNFDSEYFEKKNAQKLANDFLELLNQY
jgi:tyrocidine synthetase-3